MRTVANICLVLTISLCLHSTGFGSEKTYTRYDSGSLESISTKEIVMSGKTYRVHSSTKVIFNIPDSKGAMYKHKKKLSDLRTGDKAYLKVVGNDILEIEVMR